MILNIALGKGNAVSQRRAACGYDLVDLGAHQTGIGCKFLFNADVPTVIKDNQCDWGVLIQLPQNIARSSFCFIDLAHITHAAGSVEEHND